MNKIICTLIVCTVLQLMSCVPSDKIAAKVVAKKWLAAWQAKDRKSMMKYSTPQNIGLLTTLISTIDSSVKWADTKSWTIKKMNDSCYVVAAHYDSVKTLSLYAIQRRGEHKIAINKNYY